MNLVANWDFNEGSGTVLFDQSGNEYHGTINGATWIEDGATEDDGSCEYIDECGVCGGDNSSCSDCVGVTNGDSWESDCGCVAADNGGDDCDDCAGVPNGDAVVDECGECDGDGIADGAYDCDGTLPEEYWPDIDGDGLGFNIEPNYSLDVIASGNATIPYNPDVFDFSNNDFTISFDMKRDVIVNIARLFGNNRS